MVEAFIRSTKQRYEVIVDAPVVLMFDVVLVNEAKRVAIDADLPITLEDRNIALTRIAAMFLGTRGCRRMRSKLLRSRSATRIVFAADSYEDEVESGSPRAFARCRSRKNPRQ